jgi:hypothetical protein
MATIGKLAVQITADTAGLKAGLNDAERTVTAKADAMAASINKIGAAFAALGVASTLKNMTMEAINSADAFDEMAEKTGVSVEKLSSLAYAAKINGASVDDLGTAIRALSNKMAESIDPTSQAAKMFDGLGISVQNADGTLRNVDDVLTDLAGVFSSMEDGAAKSALAVDIFSRAGLNMIPVLNKGQQGLADLRIEAERLGAVISTDMAKQAAEFNENIDRLNTLSGTLGKTIANALVPELNNLINEFLIGIKHANGFWDALATFGTINPFKDLQGNLKGTRDELDNLNAARERYMKAGSDTSAIDQAIATEKRRLEYLKEIERQQVINAQGKDNQSQSESRRIGLSAPSRLPKPDSGGGEKQEDPLTDFIKKQEEAALQRNANMLLADKAYFEQKAEMLRQSTLTREQIAQEAYDKEVAKAKEIRDAGLITDAEYTAIEIQAAQERANALQAIEFAMIDMITAKEAEAAEIRKNLANQVATHDADVRAKQANMVVGILNTLGQKNKLFALASIALQTKMALAQNSITTAQAAALAFASQLIPGDPTSLARAAAAKAAVMAQGGVTAGLIMASGGLQAASLLSNGDSGVSFSGGSSGSSSSQQSPSVTAASNIAPQTNQVITIQGISAGEMFSGESVRGLIDQLIEAQRNGSKVVLS